MKRSTISTLAVVAGIVALGLGAFFLVRAIRSDDEGVEPPELRTLSAREKAGLPAEIPAGVPRAAQIQIRVPRIWVGEPDWGLLVWHRPSGTCWRAGEIPDLLEAKLATSGECASLDGEAFTWNVLRITDEISAQVSDAIADSGLSPPGVTAVAGYAGPAVRSVTVTAPAAEGRRVTLSRRDHAFIALFERVYEHGSIRVRAVLADGRTETQAKRVKPLPGATAPPLAP
jgi:hypothetical protein